MVTLLFRLATPARAQTGTVRDFGDPGLPPGGTTNVAPISTYIHGIAIGYVVGQTNPDAAQQTLQSSDGFTNNSVFGAEFNLFVGAELLNRVYAEMQVFYVSEGNRVDVDYTQLDIRIFRDYLFVRGGRFRVPLGNINGYPEPKFTFKLPTRPLFFSRWCPTNGKNSASSCMAAIAGAKGGRCPMRSMS